MASKAAPLASQGADVFASATAEVGQKFDDIKGGVDVRDDVQLGTPTTSGNLLDAVAVTVSDVAAGGSGKATARSNRDLSGGVKAEVGRAVRY